MAQLYHAGATIESILDNGMLIAWYAIYIEEMVLLLLRWADCIVIELQLNICVRLKRIYLGYVMLAWDWRVEGPIYFVGCYIIMLRDVSVMINFTEDELDDGLNSSWFRPFEGFE
jgi:hypothetical protein